MTQVANEDSEIMSILPSKTH